MKVFGKKFNIFSVAIVATVLMVLRFASCSHLFENYVASESPRSVQPDGYVYPPSTEAMLSGIENKITNLTDDEKAKLKDFLDALSDPAKVAMNNVLSSNPNGAEVLKALSGNPADNAKKLNDLAANDDGTNTKNDLSAFVGGTEGSQITASNAASKITELGTHKQAVLKALSGTSPNDATAAGDTKSKALMAGSPSVSSEDLYKLVNGLNSDDNKNKLSVVPNNIIKDLVGTHGDKGTEKLKDYLNSADKTTAKADLEKYESRIISSFDPNGSQTLADFIKAEKLKDEIVGKIGKDKFDELTTAPNNITPEKLKEILDKLGDNASKVKDINPSVIKALSDKNGGIDALKTYLSTDGGDAATLNKYTVPIVDEYGSSSDSLKEFIGKQNEHPVTFKVKDMSGTEHDISVTVIGTAEKTTLAEIKKAAKSELGLDNNGNPTVPFGYEFKGWVKDGDATNKALTDGDIISKTDVIKPVFTKEIVYTIYYGGTEQPNLTKKAEYEIVYPATAVSGLTVAKIFEEAKVEVYDQNRDGYQRLSRPQKAGASFGFIGWKINSETVLSSQIAAHSTLPSDYKITAVFKENHQAKLPGDGSLNLTDVTLASIGTIYVENTEVTRRQWKSVMMTNPNGDVADTANWKLPHGERTIPRANEKSGTGDDDNKPITYVTWYEAVVFCNILSEFNGLDSVFYIEEEENGQTVRNYKFYETAEAKALPEQTYDSYPAEGPAFIYKVKSDRTRNGYRLPTRDEWKEIARGGKDGKFTKYPGTTATDADGLKNVAWFSDNSDKKIHKADEKGGDNPIRDLAGNVWEWVDETEDNGKTKVVVGGGSRAPASDCEIEAKNGKGNTGNNPNVSSADTGFRVIQNK